MNEDDSLELAYLPNGNLNFPYILSNANLLLQSGEIDLAASLFRLALGEPKVAHIALFGLGQCCMAGADYPKAARAFEKALLVSRRPYIAEAHLKALKMAGELELTGTLTQQYAAEFGVSQEFSQ
jgi:tetratricopeptide (TPR) repeat protein